MSEQGQKHINYERNRLESFSSYSDHIEAISDKYNDINITQLSYALQSTHDIKDLIKIYSHNIQRFIPHNSMSFENDLMDIEISFGNKAKHSCSYNLLFSKESLGKLSLTRCREFTENELNRFEDFLSILFYPLGNTIYND